MSTKEIQDQIVKNMQEWKKVENASVASTGKVIEKTENPIIRLIMEIIQRDSQMHYRIQDDRKGKEGYEDGPHYRRHHSP